MDSPFYRAAAIHEAGHAVAAHTVGMVVDRVYLELGRGTTDVRFRPEDKTNRDLRWLVAIVGGYVAEVLSGFAVDLDTLKEDLDLIHEHAAYLVGSETPELVYRVASCVFEVLGSSANSDTLVAVSEELLKRGCLQGEELLGLLEGGCLQGEELPLLLERDFPGRDLTAHA